MKKGHAPNGTITIGTTVERGVCYEVYRLMADYQARHFAAPFPATHRDRQGPAGRATGRTRQHRPNTRHKDPKPCR